MTNAKPVSYHHGNLIGTLLGNGKVAITEAGGKKVKAVLTRKEAIEIGKAVGLFALPRHEIRGAVYHVEQDNPSESRFWAGSGREYDYDSPITDPYALAR